MNALTRFATRAAVRPLPTTTGGTGYPWQDGDILYADDLNAAITPNVKNLGATGDGVTDDGPAFIAALAAAAGGGAVVIPAGTYRIGSALPRNFTGGVSIVGAGSGATVLVFPNGTDGLMLTLTGNADVHVHGMTIKRTAAGAYTNTGLSITSPTPNNSGDGITTVHDVVMTGAWLTGINIARSGASLTDVTVAMANATGSGPGVGIKVSGVDTDNYCTSVRLNNVITVGGNTGFLIGTWVQGVYVDACDFIGNDYGIQWAGVAGNADLWLGVTNSHFNSGTRGVLSFNGLSVQITNTYSLHFGCPAIGDNYAAFEFHNISPGMISGCSIYGDGPSSPSSTETAIALNGGFNVVVSDNFISGHKNVGIYVNATKNTLITGNIAGLPPGIPLVQYGAMDPSNQAYGNQLNGVPDFTVDPGNGNFYVPHTIQAAEGFIAQNGLFEVSPTTYMRYDGGTGNWIFVDAGVTKFTIASDGSVTAAGNVIAAGGQVSSVTFNANGVKVLGPRIVGWGASTGGARGPITASSTLPQVAAALSQLLTDLEAHGMLGG